MFLLAPTAGKICQVLHGVGRPKRKVLQAHRIAGLMASRSGSRATDGDHGICRASHHLLPPFRHFLPLSFTSMLRPSLLSFLPCSSRLRLPRTPARTVSNSMSRRVRAKCGTIPISSKEATPSRVEHAGKRDRPTSMTRAKTRRTSTSRLWKQHESDKHEGARQAQGQAGRCRG